MLQVRRELPEVQLLQQVQGGVVLQQALPEAGLEEAQEALQGRRLEGGGEHWVTRGSVAVLGEGVGSGPARRQ